MANDTTITITITGNLTRDPDLRFTPSGAAWVRFAIAATPRRYDKATGQWIDGEALFLDCTAWRELAEQITESLTKGTRVVATGRLRQRSWETDDGQKRTTFELELDDIGPSLRFATAKVTKATRRTGGQAPPPDDPWATTPASPDGPADRGTAGNGSSPAMAASPAGASSGGFGSYEEPPF